MQNRFALRNEELLSHTPHVRQVDVQAIPNRGVHKTDNETMNSPAYSILAHVRPRWGRTCAAMNALATMRGLLRPTVLKTLMLISDFSKNPFPLHAYTYAYTFVRCPISGASGCQEQHRSRLLRNYNNLAVQHVILVKIICNFAGI